MIEELLRATRCSVYYSLLESVTRSLLSTYTDSVPTPPTPVSSALFQTRVLCTSYSSPDINTGYNMPFISGCRISLSVKFFIKWVTYTTMQLCYRWSRLSCTDLRCLTSQVYSTGTLLTHKTLTSHSLCMRVIRPDSSDHWSCEHSRPH